jgi:NAD(P)-dependent dehydrogenase (short-subunit alcohol dehydrogenase family)
MRAALRQEAPTSQPAEAEAAVRRLDGKVAIVTGGSSGIGRASALRFAEEGARVIIGDIRTSPREGGESTHDLIGAAGGDSAFVETDVTDETAVDRLIQHALSRYAGLHIIMTAAGNVGPTGDSLNVDIRDVEKHFELNVFGSFLCAQRALRHFRRARYGKVIMVSSNFGTVGVARIAAYCAGKAAVIGFVQALALEFGPLGININALCPGATRTAINEDTRADAEIQQHWQLMTPLRMEGGAYIAEPGDQANAALFLASEESRFMTGACLIVDGGWAAR